MSNKVNKVNEEIKAKIKSINQNKVLVDELTGVSGTNKGNLLRWAEGTGLDKHLADNITLKSEGNTNAILKPLPRLQAGQSAQQTHFKKQNGNCPRQCSPNQTKSNLERSLHPTTHSLAKRKRNCSQTEKKRTKIIERYNVGIKSMGPLANKTHEIVLNYKTGEEGSKWKTNAAKDTNDKKKKNTPPPRPRIKKNNN